MTKANKPSGMTEAEYRFRCAAYKLEHEREPGTDFLTRPMAITAFAGHYGPAGYVLTVNGSPTRSLIVVAGHDRHNAAMYRLDHSGRAQVLSKGRSLEPTTGPKFELVAGVWALLQERGLIDDRGNFTTDYRAECVQENATHG